MTDGPAKRLPTKRVMLHSGEHPIWAEECVFMGEQWIAPCGTSAPIGRPGLGWTRRFRGFPPSAAAISAN